MHNFLFLGDSITDCSRLWLPETNGLGNGYVSILAKKLNTLYPDAVIRNKGFDGFTVPALQQRLVSFVSGSHADVICLLIGINDLGLALQNTDCSLPAYEQHFTQNYRHLLESLRFLTDARILCIAPFIFPYPQEYLLWVPFVRSMEKIISELAPACQADCLLMQDTFCKSIVQPSDYQLLTTDGIHLTARGHQILADAVLPLLSLSQSFSSPG